MSHSALSRRERVAEGRVRAVLAPQFPRSARNDPPSKRLPCAFLFRFHRRSLATARDKLETWTDMRVTEIFHSIQGESTHAGRPCVFVRLTGCNLRCTWCDTEYAFFDGRRMPLAEVAEIVRGYRCDLIEVTGGEPLLQEGVYPLMDALLESGHTVMIETSGAIDVGRLDPRVIKIMDLKCPGSGECERNLWSNLDHLTVRDEIKFVIADRADY